MQRSGEKCESIPSRWGDPDGGKSWASWREIGEHSGTMSRIGPWGLRTGLQDRAGTVCSFTRKPWVARTKQQCDVISALQ